MELGRFRGENPEAWIFQAECYFEFYCITENHKLPQASFYLDSEALEWYRWLFRNKQLIDWEHFTSKLLIRFQKRHLKSAEGRLAKIRQLTTVSEYQSRFEAIANETNDIKESLMVRLFCSGLKEDIKTSVLIHEPTTMDEALHMAHVHEKRIQLEKGPIKPAFAKTQPLLPTPNLATNLPSNSSNSLIPITLSRPNSGRPPLKRLTHAEIQNRRERGLCYYCDEKYSSTHK